MKKCKHKWEFIDLDRIDGRVFTRYVCFKCNSLKAILLDIVEVEK